MAMSDELDRLGDLHRRGVLTEDEFTRAKQRVLGGPPTGDAPLDALNGLSRTREDRWIGGVCGGIARSTGMATWVWRLIFVLAALCGGSGLLFYLLLWLLVPADPPRALRNPLTQ
jgi:phage shock protein C